MVRQIKTKHKSKGEWHRDTDLVFAGMTGEPINLCAAPPPMLQTAAD